LNFDFRLTRAQLATLSQHTTCTIIRTRRWYQAIHGRST